MKKHHRIFSACLLGTLLMAGCILFPAVEAAAVTPHMASSSQAAASSIPDEQLPAILCGTWSGILPTVISQGKHVEDPVVMSVPGKAGNQKLVFQLDSYDGRYLLPNEWSVSQGTLRFSLYDPAWRMNVELRAVSERQLEGKISQYGVEIPLTLYKSSNFAEDLTASPRFLFEGKEAWEWQEKLETYPAFSEESFAPIPFTYELRRWDRSLQLISRYPELAQAISGSDLQTMKAVMDLLCGHFQHNGASGMPEDTSVFSVLTYYDTVGSKGIECRGMAILLSEMLRLCGIPAKPITCLPDSDPCEECHVVVHAYSAEQGSWVLLDPTYQLMLQDATGRYVGLPELRQALISGDMLYANADAGHNGMPFTMDWYRAYMTKNTFRFSSAVHFSALSQESGEGVARWMLIPEGFTLPTWAQRPEQVTTSAADFWAAP